MIESLSSVGVFTRDQRRAKQFYTRKIGLKVRRHIPALRYLAVGSSKGGQDASLTVWRPDASTWGTDFEPAVRRIGQVTGIGFATLDLDATVEGLHLRQVRAAVLGEEAGERYGWFFDADQNMFFLVEPAKPHVQRAGLAGMDFVTIVTRDRDVSVDFFHRALGMHVRWSRKEDYVECRLGARGTAIAPFTPRREDYQTRENYERDMAHLGEKTMIFFSTRDILRDQEHMLDLGVRFTQKAGPAGWGGMWAEFLDPDGNAYGLVQMETESGPTS